MSIRPEGTALVLLEEAVVDISKEWLEEDEDEQHNTNDGMSVIEPADLGGKVNSNTKGRNIDEVCEHLHNSVKPKKPAKAEQSNADSSKWEEDDKGQRCKDTMCDLSALGLFKVTAEGD